MQLIHRPRNSGKTATCVAAAREAAKRGDAVVIVTHDRASADRIQRDYSFADVVACEAAAVALAGRRCSVIVDNAELVLAKLLGVNVVMATVTEEEKCTK